MGESFRHLNRSIMCKCEKCGKDIYIPIPGEWAYKKSGHTTKHNYNMRYFCSWGCMRSWEKERERKKKKAFNYW